MNHEHHASASDAIEPAKARSADSVPDSIGTDKYGTDAYRDGPPQGATAFVSRSADEPPPIRESADGEPLPTWRDLRWILALIFALQLFSWWTLEGYQLADSVEYMERSYSAVKGEEMIDSKAIRSFGFSSLILPFFGLWELLGIDDVRPVVYALRLFQMVLGLLLVLSCARISARLFSRQAGFAGAFLIGVNPIFLQYTVSPLSGIAAGLFVGLAFECGMQRTRVRSSLWCGIWLGMAFLMAYQAILIIAPFLFVLLLRDRWRYRRHLLATGVGSVLAVGVQVVLDKLSYGRFGASLSRYLLENVGYNLASILHRQLGMTELATKVYGKTQELLGHVYVPPAEVTAGTPEVVQLQGTFWYFENFESLLVWPVAVFALLGMLFAWKRLSWSKLLLFVVLGANVFVMCFKGSKSFRLWLPLLPLIIPLCAGGWALFSGALQSSHSHPVRRWVANVALVAALVLGVQALQALNTRRFGVFWEAMDLITEETLGREPEREALPHEEESGKRWRVSAAYHWAVYLREPPEVELIKLPHHLDAWRAYSDEERAEDLEMFDSLDWFITHQPILTLAPDLCEALNSRFEVHAGIYHSDVAQGLGPVLVLRRRTGDPRAKLLYERIEGEDPAEWSRAHGLAEPLDFIDTESGERLRLLGWQYESLAGDRYEFGWITYHWTTPTGLSRNYHIIDRLIAPDERNAWQNDHAGAWGVHPTSTWKPGTIVRESYLVIPAQEPYGEAGLTRWIGGPYRRGDLLPVSLYLKLQDLESGVRLAPARPGSDVPIRAGSARGAHRTSDGYTFSPDDLVRVGGLFLPVLPIARIPDDGSSGL